MKSILASGSAEAILKLGAEQSNLAMNRLIENLSSSKTESSNSILDISLARLSQMESLSVSKDEIEEFQNTFESRESIAHEIKAVTKKIQKIDDDSLSEYSNDLNALNEELQTHAIVLAALNSEKESNITKIQALVKDRTAAERAVVLEDVDQAVLDTIDKIVETLSVRMDSIISKAKSTLTKEINSMYTVLKNNEDMVKEIKLSDNYDLQVYNFDNLLLKTQGLSEGEKSILMYSVIYGLHSLSQLQFPLIIDSPIGRMDSIHSDHLASKLYPTVSNQLILLSHNREIVGQLHDKLRSRIVSEYTITKFGTPKISPGYFD